LERFRRLQDAGRIEIITSAATHAYLPLLGRDSSVQAQLETGVRALKHYFGSAPQGFWLPECAYRSGQDVEMTRTESYRRPALDEYLSSLGAKYFVADSHAVSGGEAGAGGKGRFYALSEGLSAAENFPVTGRTSFRPYVTRAGVSVFGRHEAAGKKVWSSDGYPSNADYRDFHRRDAASGLPYRRCAEPKSQDASRGLYDPEAAQARARAQAEDFAHFVETSLSRFQAEHNVRGVVAAAFDMELFGHRWHEGLSWLENFLRRIAHDQVVDLLPLGAYLREEPAVQAIEVPESSWGQGGGHATWKNSATENMWTEIHAAELAMENLVATIPQATDLEMRYLRQAGRELFLLQASDWPFLISTDQAREYAEERFHGHLERFRGLARALKEGHAESQAALEELSRCETLDNCFSRLDPHLFARRQSQPVRNPVSKFVGIG
jgi:1,4-alpha-glucan branching enzyme